MTVRYVVADYERHTTLSLTRRATSQALPPFQLHGIDIDKVYNFSLS